MQTQIEAALQPCQWHMERIKDNGLGSKQCIGAADQQYQKQQQQQQKQYKNLNYATERDREREGEFVGKQAVRGKQERLADT